MFSVVVLKNHICIIHINFATCNKCHYWKVVSAMASIFKDVVLFIWKPWHAPGTPDRIRWSWISLSQVATSSIDFRRKKETEQWNSTVSEGWICLSSVSATWSLSVSVHTHNLFKAMKAMHSPGQLNRSKWVCLTTQMWDQDDGLHGPPEAPENTPMQCSNPKRIQKAAIYNRMGRIVAPEDSSSIVDGPGNPMSCIAVSYGLLMFRKSLSITLIWILGFAALAWRMKSGKSDRKPRRNSRLDVGAVLLFMASYILLSALLGFACIT